MQWLIGQTTSRNVIKYSNVLMVTFLLKGKLLYFQNKHYFFVYECNLSDEFRSIRKVEQVTLTDQNLIPEERQGQCRDVLGRECPPSHREEACVPRTLKKKGTKKRLFPPSLTHPQRKKLDDYKANT